MEITIGKSLIDSLNAPISDIFKSVKQTKTFQTPRTKTILQRVAASEKKAIDECLQIYGNYVWTLAGKCCESTEEREKIVREIFQDIWENAGDFDAEIIDEKNFIAILSLRRLLNRKN